MDARIVVEPAEAFASAPVAMVHAIVVVDWLVKRLVSLFDATAVLAPLLNMGNSVTAVAPDFITRGGVSGWASA